MPSVSIRHASRAVSAPLLMPYHVVHLVRWPMCPDSLSLVVLLQVGYGPSERASQRLMASWAEPNGVASRSQSAVQGSSKTSPRVQDRPLSPRVSGAFGACRAIFSSQTSLVPTAQGAV